MGILRKSLDGGVEHIMGYNGLMLDKGSDIERCRPQAVTS